MRRGSLAILGAFTLALTSGVAASSADATTQIIVTPTHTQGWSTNDTNADGSVTFVSDPTAPGSPHNGALQLTTAATVAAKAQYVHATSTPLANVTELSYWTKQVVASFPAGDPAYQLIAFLNGGTGGFTTLVFEPYQNPLQGPVVNNVWQPWDVDSGLFWSTRTVTCSNGTIVGTPGGPATYTLSQINSTCPNALVAAFGVNIGSNNPGWTVRADLVDFNGTIYNFEPDTKPGCRGATGQGQFFDNGRKGDMGFTHTCRNGQDDPDEDSFASSDRGDGSDFHSSSVSSVVIDDSAGTITMTGIGSSTGGLPVTFVLVALPTTAATPGWVSMTFGDGFVTAGDLVSGAISIEQ